MAEPGYTSTQGDPTRQRFEHAIGLAAPLLDLVLSAGDRISKFAEPVDYEYYPVRDEDEPEEPAAGVGPRQPSSL